MAKIVSGGLTTREVKVETVSKVTSLALSIDFDSLQAQSLVAKAGGEDKVNTFVLSLIENALTTKRKGRKVGTTTTGTRRGGTSPEVKGASLTDAEKTALEDAGMPYKGKRLSSPQITLVSNLRAGSVQSVESDVASDTGEDLNQEENKVVNTETPSTEEDKVITASDLIDDDDLESLLED